MTKNNKARIVQINVSSGGVPKEPVPSAVVTELGIITDSQNDTVHHSGLDRALVIYSLEKIRDLQQEGHPIYPGSIGENITISGLNWEDLRPGITLQIGEILTEVARYPAPCKKIEASFSDGDFGRVSQKKYPGWSRVSLRVLEGGSIKVGDIVLLTE